METHNLKDWIDTYPDRKKEFENPQDCILEGLFHIANELVRIKKDTCNWEWNGDYWTTECGHAFLETEEECPNCKGEVT